jgi:hypothetical protein
MLLLFAGGVMNLMVIAALTAFVAFEKLAPFACTARGSAACCSSPQDSGGSYAERCTISAFSATGRQSERSFMTDIPRWTTTLS